MGIAADCVVTRGALRTPEQYLPEQQPANQTKHHLSGQQQLAQPEPWEACFTLGRQWQYRGVHEVYKSTNTLVNTLIATRAGGGNLLLNLVRDLTGALPSSRSLFLVSLVCGCSPITMRFIMFAPIIRNVKVMFIHPLPQNG